MTEDGNSIMIFTGKVIKIFKLSLSELTLDTDFELGNVSSDIMLYGFQGNYRYIVYSTTSNSNTLLIASEGKEVQKLTINDNDFLSVLIDETNQRLIYVDTNGSGKILNLKD